MGMLLLVEVLVVYVYILINSHLNSDCTRFQSYHSNSNKGEERRQALFNLFVQHLTGQISYKDTIIALDWVDILQDIISALDWADILHLSIGLDGNVEHFVRSDGYHCQTKSRIMTCHISFIHG